MHAFRAGGTPSEPPPFNPHAPPVLAQWREESARSAVGWDAANRRGHALLGWAGVALAHPSPVYRTCVLPSVCTLRIIGRAKQK